MPVFKFKLGDRAKITSSGETGKIVGRAEYTTSENTYHLHYKCADGRAVTAWWDESFLEALAACQEQPEESPTIESKFLAGLVQPVQAQPSADVPKCIQCRHFAKAAIHERFDRCLHPGYGVDPVRGLPMAPACELVREASRSHQTCGDAGQWFEAATACAGLQTQTSPAPAPSLSALLAPAGLSGDGQQQLQAWLIKPLFSQAEAP